MELLSASAVAAALMLVTPGEMSKAYALVMIVTSVLPGLILTGDLKLINAGISHPSNKVLFKTFVTAGLNIPLGVLALAIEDANQVTLTVFIVLALVAALGSSAQAFSSTWYYAQTDKGKTMRSKMLSAGIKITCAVTAIFQYELTWALVGTAFGAIFEFILNFNSLKRNNYGKADYRSKLISPLGLAYGLARILSAGIRIGLSTLFGPLIASFLIIEQIVGGTNSLFEKYFVRSVKWRHTIRWCKAAYLVGMLAFVPWLVSQSLSPSDKLSLLWLILVACASLLPLTEMYAALVCRGERYVAIGSISISIVCAISLFVSWRIEVFSSAALIAYVALPGTTFLYYWISSHACNHSKH